MAVYNEILHGRFARSLQKIFGIKGGVPAKQLAGDVTAVHNLFSGVENRYLEQWQRFAFGANTGAAASNNSGFILRNPGGGPNQLTLPGGSDLIVIVESVFVSGTVAQQLEVQTGAAGSATDFSTVASPQNLDLRYGQLTGSAVKISYGNKLGAQLIGTAIAELQIGGNNAIQFINNENQEITLLPGSAFEVVTQTVNSAFFFGISWRQRYLEEAERSSP